MQDAFEAKVVKNKLILNADRLRQLTFEELEEEKGTRKTSGVYNGRCPYTCRTTG